MQETFDELYKQSRNNQQFKHLVEIISTKENISLAYRNIKTNKGKNTAGVDKNILEDIEELTVEEYIPLVQSGLNNYTPGMVRRIEIPKDDGTTRPLGIPCMIDRIIQQCILQVLDPICEAKFYDYSFGFRPNRSQEHAMARFMYHVNKTQLHYVVDIDIKKFFDSVDHAKLLKQVWTLGVRDKNLFKILKKILEAEVKGIGIPEKGTPAGGILSPLLSNIVLNEMDWWIANQWDTFETKHKYSRQGNKFRVLKSSNLKEMHLVRFADDFKILCRDSKTAFKVFRAVKMFLKERLQLEINTEKSKVTNLRKNYTTFLGFKLKAKIKGKTKKNKPKQVCISHISDKAMSKIKDELLKQIKYIQKNPIIKAVILLNSMILGLHNYFNIATHITKDFGRINFNLIRTIKSRLKPNSKGEHSASYLKLYERYCKRKVIEVASVDIYPIYGVRMKIPYNFNQEKCKYTIRGRELIHKQAPSLHHLVKYILETALNETVKFYDNRISLLYQQKGKCAITGLDLNTDNMHCHHKTPKSIGGTDDYSNLVYVLDFVHKLIHATTLETHQKLWNQLVIKMKLNTKSELEKVLKKVNHYRVMAGNLPLILKAR